MLTQYCYLEFSVPEISWKKLESVLAEVYSETESSERVAKIQEIAQDFESRSRAQSKSQSNGFEQLDETDTFLIAYANSICSSDKSPLATFHEFLKEFRIPDITPNLHFLPFFPWDTDRGFSVIDYHKVEPEYGDWDDLKEIASDVKLMYDFVANHASIENEIAQKALIAEHIPEEDPQFEDCKKYKNFLITYPKDALPKDEDLQLLSRPRAFPALTAYRVVKDLDGYSAVLGDPEDGEEVIGEGVVWTTFSRGLDASGKESTRQVDLNYANPEVFLEVVRILLFYVEKCASFIRLDAIGYIWKRLGSVSIHEPECHRLLEAMNIVSKLISPETVTIAEVNERQSNAFKYIGTEERPEADMAYQFTHFPMAIHALKCKSAYFYTNWLRSLRPLGGRQFITVLGSHDGLGLKPLRGTLPKDAIEMLSLHLVDAHGAKPNFAKLPGGKQIIYEICATPWCLVNNPNVEEDFELQLKRYMVVVALGLGIPGTPAFYINGLLGSKNYIPPEGLDENRTVNREVFDFQELAETLQQKDSQMAQVLQAIRSLVAERKNFAAFRPDSTLHVLDTEADSCVAQVLVPKDKTEKSLIQLVNVSDEPEEVTVYLRNTTSKLENVFGAKPYRRASADTIVLTLEPYEIVWLVRHS